jgi:rhodanese-related sulfurtransferase
MKMIRNTSIVFVLALAVSASAPETAQAQFGSLFGRKSSVAEISVDQLRSLRLDATADESTEAPQFVLVDVRTPEEYSVSVIPGAITKSEFERNIKRYRASTVITYCTSGYRSGQYAQKLVSQGIQAKNFRGSVLGWCRAGLPLQTPQGEATNRVHTYSSKNRVPAKYNAVW